jgi:hypothetical protein
MKLAANRARRFVALIVGAGCVGFLLVFFLVIPALRVGDEKSASPGVGGASPSPSAASGTSSPAPSATPTGEPSAIAPPRPHIIDRPIAFGPERRKQMAAYSRNRYGDSSIVLMPKVVVLHYTAMPGGWYSAWSLFDSNAPNASGIPNDLPGTVTHFIIDKDGAIYQLIPLDLRGRHAIGLNHVAIGIELVDEGSGGNAATVRRVFQRKRQIDAGLALVRWLQYRFDIPTRDVIGHGTADDSRYFKDLEGFKNDHGDWGAAQVRLFRKRLRELGAASKASLPVGETPRPSPSGGLLEASPSASLTQSTPAALRATASAAAGEGGHDLGQGDAPIRTGFFTVRRSTDAALAVCTGGR